MARVDARTIQELGGWKKLEMVERYTHLVPDHKVAAIQKLRNNVPDIFPTEAEQGKIGSCKLFKISRMGKHLVRKRNV